MVVPGQRNLSFDDLILEIGNLLHFTSKKDKGEKQEIRKSESYHFLNPSCLESSVYLFII